MSQHPPTDEARIDLFLALVDDYRELAEALPTNPVMTLGGERDPQDHWHRLLRAFALRKFTAPSDPVYLPTVAAALQALLPSESHGDGDFKGGMKATLKELEEGQVGYGTAQGMLRAKEIVRDVLYGRYLHGDYDKWRRSTTRLGLLEEHALWEWLSNVEDYVFKLAKELRQLREDGTIPFPGGTATTKNE